MKAGMLSARQIIEVLSIAALTGSLVGCDKGQGGSVAPAASSKAPTPAPSAPAVSASAAASATASAAPAPKPSHACPDGSTGEGTFKNPCEAKGASRIMTVQWTGKTDDKGPHFRVTNNAKLDVLYGTVVVYFYDKAGKQLEVPAAGASTPARPKQTCSGQIFAGPMKAAEKAVLTFSCVKKEHVPDAAAAVEAEIQTVGFTDASGAKADTFWRNNDLVPDERRKGGVK
jgi:hypothetical protein